MREVRGKSRKRNFAGKLGIFMGWGLQRVAVGRFYEMLPAGGLTIT
jgi:hypothetical protein